jgi:hypothetical protein
VPEPDQSGDLIQLRRIIFQIVDGNMVVSKPLHALEKPAQGAATEYFARSFEIGWGGLRWPDSKRSAGQER